MFSMKKRRLFIFHLKNILQTNQKSQKEREKTLEKRWIKNFETTKIGSRAGQKKKHCTNEKTTRNKQTNKREKNYKFLIKTHWRTTKKRKRKHPINTKRIFIYLFLMINNTSSSSSSYLDFRFHIFDQTNFRFRSYSFLFFYYSLVLWSRFSFIHSVRSIQFNEWMNESAENIWELFVKQQQEKTNKKTKGNTYRNK